MSAPVGVCKLCLKEKELRRSHIIPEFMYKNVYDDNPKRYYNVSLTGDDAKIQIEQKGKREYLLCGDCEVILSKYELYAAEHFYGTNSKSAVKKVQQEISADGKIMLTSFVKFQFNAFKLFLDSILWRILISESFPTKDYGHATLEALRMSLLQGTALPTDSFPCVLNAVFAEPNKVLVGIMTSPYEYEYQGRQILRVFIDGFNYMFYMTGGPQDELNPALQMDGSLKVIGTMFNQMENLKGLMVKPMEALGEKIKQSKNK